jgi:hypothetical protein
MKQLTFVFAAALTAILAWTPVSAQKPDRPAAPPTITPPEEPAGKPLIPLDVQIVVSRFRGEKKISSVPFSLAVNANDKMVSQLRMGANVPVPSTMVTPKGNASGQPGPLPGPVSYRDIGTAIDCNASSLDDGRFQLFVSVEDSSVYTEVQDGATPAVNDMPVFRSFKSKNTLVLRDGQTRQFTAATDRVNGEIVKIDVTLRVVK